MSIYNIPDKKRNFRAAHSAAHSANLSAGLNSLAEATLDEMIIRYPNLILVVLLYGMTQDSLSESY